MEKRQPYTIKELDYIADRVAERVLEELKQRDEPLTTKQVADILGITTKAVQARCRAGSLPGKKRGKYYYFNRKDILKLTT